MEWKILMSKSKMGKGNVLMMIMRGEEKIDYKLRSSTLKLGIYLIRMKSKRSPKDK